MWGRATYVAALSAVLLWPLAAAPLRAQDPGSVLGPKNSVRPFAEPEYWENSVPPDRLPIRERRLTNRLGFAGFAPPPTQREGLTPSLGFAVVQRDSSQTPPGADSFAALNFGLAYAKSTSRWQLQADYSIEATGAEGASGGIDSHGGSLNFGYDISTRDRLSLAVFHSSTIDLQSATLQGALAQATEIETSSFLGSYGHRFSTRTAGELTFSLQRQTTDQPGAPDVTGQGLTGQLWHFLGPTARIDGSLRFERFDFGSSSETLQEAQLGYTADLGQRLAAGAHVNLLRTSADGGDSFAGLGGQIVRTWDAARLQLDLDRDILTVPGLGDPVLSDQLQATLDLRLQPGLFGTVIAERQRVEILSAGRETSHVTAIEGQLSYALNTQLWLWGSMRFSEERGGGTTREDTTFSIGVTRNLR